MLLGEFLWSDLVIDIEEGIAHEVHIGQGLLFIRGTQLVLIAGKAVFVAIADIYIVLLAEVILNIALYVRHTTAVARHKDRARGTGVNLIRIGGTSREERCYEEKS